MKHIKLYEQFVNEAAAVKVTLTPDLFDDKNSTWGMYQDLKDTGCSTWKINCNLLADSDDDIIIGERNVVMFSVSVWDDGEAVAKIGTTNSLKREPSGTFGKNFTFNVEDFKANSKKLSTEIADFLVDKEHFNWINKSITSNRTPLKITPKGDFSQVIEKLIEAAIK